MSDFAIPLGIKLARSPIKALLRGIFYILSPITIEGKENIPYGKPYIVAMNHVSLFDPPFIAAFWPEMLEIIGAQSVFEKFGQKTITPSLWRNPCSPRKL